MGADKMLAEWFWIDRWVGSSAFGLNISARGLYREMLTQAWRRGARLPNDPDQIRRVVGVTQVEWNRSWSFVKPYWRVDGEFLVNDTQLEVYADSQDRQRRASDRGKAGAAARYERKRHQGTAQTPTQASTQAHAQAQHKDKPPISDLRSPIGDRQKASVSRAREGGRLFGTEHRSHAACGRVCVPDFLHRQFVKALGGDEEAANTRVRDWYLSVQQQFNPDDPVPTDEIAFWRKRFDAEFVRSTTATRSEAQELEDMQAEIARQNARVK